MKKLYLIIAIIALVSVVSAYSLEVMKTQEFAQLQTRMEPAGAIYNYSRPEPTYVMQLKTITFLPEELTYQQIASVVDQDNVYYLVQWKSFSLIEYGLMKLYGIGNIGYIHNDTYLIMIPSGAKPTLLYGSIRWIGIMQPEWKMTPTLRNYINSLGQNETIGIVIDFFESIDGDQLNEIKNLSENVIGYENEISIIEIKVSKINDITNLSFVKWIEPRSQPSLGIMLPKIIIDPSLNITVDSLNSNETVGIIVKFFEPINDEQLDRLKEFSIKIINFKKPYDSIDVEVIAAKIDEIATLAFVERIKINYIKNV